MWWVSVLKLDHQLEIFIFCKIVKLLPNSSGFLALSTLYYFSEMYAYLGSTVTGQTSVYFYVKETYGISSPAYVLMLSQQYAYV